MEYAEMGTLKNYSQSITQWKMRAMFVDLFKGIEYLHSNGIYHGDLHEENVLLCTDWYSFPLLGFVLKYVDFGLSSVIDPSFRYDLLPLTYKILMPIHEITNYESIVLKETIEQLLNELQNQKKTLYRNFLSSEVSLDYRR